MSVAPPVVVEDRVGRQTKKGYAMSDLQEKITRLRAAAQWLEDTELPEGANVVIGQGPVLCLFTFDADDLRTVRRLVGPVAKEESGSGGMLLRGALHYWDAEVPVKIWPPADLCRQVQVGTETVEREVPTATETVTEEVPVFEWDCGPILADEEAVA